MKEINKKISKETELMLSDDAAIIGVYEKVLSGELRSFPPYTWELPNSLYYAKVIVRYLFEHKLKWDIEEIKENYNQIFIKKYRIYGMLKKVFNHNQFKLIENAYPSQIKPWEFKRSVRGTWEAEENKQKALKWLFEEKLGWGIEEIKAKLSRKTFTENGLAGCLFFYNDSPYEAINSIYPNQILPWELRRVAKKYWIFKENRTKVTKWLIEEKMGWGIEEVKKQLSSKTFIENGLGSLLVTLNGSPYELFNEAYPNLLKPWELHNVGPDFWSSDKNKKDALHWLFEDKLQWDINRIKGSSTKEIREVVTENGLSGMFSNLHFRTVYEMVKFAYPEEEFKNIKTMKKQN